MNRSYSEALKYKYFGDRLSYLTLMDDNAISPRDISQIFYKKDKRWEPTRRYIINRDMGFDLGVPGHGIDSIIIVHHINPITYDDIMNDAPCLLDPENLISVSLKTHNLIHYGKRIETQFIERTPNDMSFTSIGESNGDHSRGNHKLHSIGNHGSLRGYHF